MAIDPPEKPPARHGQLWNPLEVVNLVSSCRDGIALEAVAQQLERNASARVIKLADVLKQQIVELNQVTGDSYRPLLQMWLARTGGKATHYPHWIELRRFIKEIDDARKKFGSL